MVNKISFKTKLGWISAFENNGKIVKIKFGKTSSTKVTVILRKFKSNLFKYFEKKTRIINCSFKIEGSKIQKKIWYELRKIKFGKTKSYGEIGKKFKISPRHVGKICSQNKLVLLIPCHRIIKSNGTLGGFSSIGGLMLKKKLLKFEKNENINIATH